MTKTPFNSPVDVTMYPALAIILSSLGFFLMAWFIV
jgi:hypothetical protein